MSLSCGIIGLPSCGKTTIYNAITAAGVSSFGSEMNKAVVNVPDKRLDKLADIFKPRKKTAATLEVVDIPGLKPSQGEGRGSRLLGYIKDVDALLHVVRCFEDVNVPFEYETIDPVRDIETVNLELLAADSATLQNKINRIDKRAKSGNKDAVRELTDCQKVYDAIQQGVLARKQNLNSHEKESVYECNLVSLKPTLYIANLKSVADKENKYVKALSQMAQSEGTEVISICGKDEADISQLDKSEQAEFLHELGLEESSIERLIAVAYRLTGLISFFTTGSDEVRAWTCLQGDKAPVAAGKIHTDFEKGFIRMEVMRYEDLVAYGSEEATIKAGKQHLEGRDYVVQDGDIVTVLFNK